MAFPVGVFAKFVLPRLARSVLIGERLGPSFSNIVFINALRVSFPELTLGQVGQLASAALSARGAGRTLEESTSPFSISPGLVPQIQGLSAILSPGNEYFYQLRLGYAPKAGSPLEFTRTVFEFGGPTDVDTLHSVALATLNARIIDSPEAFGFAQPGEVEIEVLTVQYIIRTEL